MVQLSDLIVDREAIGGDYGDNDKNNSFHVYQTFDNGFGSRYSVKNMLALN